MVSIDTTEVTQYASEDLVASQDRAVDYWDFCGFGDNNSHFWIQRLCDSVGMTGIASRCLRCSNRSCLDWVLSRRFGNCRSVEVWEARIRSGWLWKIWYLLVELDVSFAFWSFVDGNVSMDGWVEYIVNKMRIQRLRWSLEDVSIGIWMLGFLVKFVINISGTIGSCVG